MFYTFTYAGGVSGADDWDGEPGENIGVIELIDSAGNVIASDDDYESTVNFFAEANQTVFVRVTAFVKSSQGNSPAPAAMTGGYTLDVQEVDPAQEDPLELHRLGERGQRAVCRREWRSDGLCLFRAGRREFRRDQ